MRRSKFYIEDNRPFIDKVKDFGQSLLFWRGRKKGIVHTRDIEWDDIRYIFFPRRFSEKYGYLGSVPDDKYYNKAMVPLVLAMDYEAKPWWCPRWFLRFLQVFGNDNSIVRVRNRRLHDLFNKITKGIQITDTKWKWESFRIYGYFTKELDELAKTTCIKIENDYHNYVK